MLIEVDELELSPVIRLASRWV